MQPFSKNHAVLSRCRDRPLIGRNSSFRSREVELELKTAEPARNVPASGDVLSAPKPPPRREGALLPVTDASRRAGPYPTIDPLQLTAAITRLDQRRSGRIPRGATE